jgi:hypothetical protein
MCRAYQHQGTVTAGTIFDKTRTPLRVWLAAAWYLTNQKQGVSALGLQRVLGLGSYQTAWTMLHRFRRAMVRPDRDRLKGQVEVDETYLAITDREEPVSPVGRKNKTTKVLVVLAVELLQPRGFGRIRLRRIDNDSEACVVPFVQASIEPGARHRAMSEMFYTDLSNLDSICKTSYRETLINIAALAGVDQTLTIRGVPDARTLQIVLTRADGSKQSCTIDNGGHTWPGGTPIPGLGYTGLSAIQNLDYPVITGVVIVGALFAIAANTVVDLSHAVLDPRLRRVTEPG